MCSHKCNTDSIAKECILGLCVCADIAASESKFIHKSSNYLKCIKNKFDNKISASTSWIQKLFTCIYSGKHYNFKWEAGSMSLDGISALHKRYMHINKKQPQSIVLLNYCSKQKQWKQYTHCCYDQK